MSDGVSGEPNELEPVEPSDAELAQRGDPRVGVAYAVGVRSDQDPRNATMKQTVLTFRLRRVGADGRLLPPVAVELRGSLLSGMVAEGDLIRLPDAAPHGGGLQLDSVENLTTGSEVAVREPKRATWLAALIGIAVIVIFAITLLGVLGVLD